MKNNNQHLCHHDIILNDYKKKSTFTGGNVQTKD